MSQSKQIDLKQANKIIETLLDSPHVETMPKEQWVVKGFRGVGLISPKWNVKLYNSKKKGWTVVTTDFHGLDSILNHSVSQVT